MTEYLYDRENPKSLYRQRLMGLEGFMYGSPNMNERADMIGRYVIMHFVFDSTILTSIFI